MSSDNKIQSCSDGISRLMVDTVKVRQRRSKGETRGQRGTGLTHECGVFGCIAAGDWPSSIDVGQVICLGKFFFTLSSLKMFSLNYI